MGLQGWDGSGYTVYQQLPGRVPAATPWNPYPSGNVHHISHRSREKPENHRLKSAGDWVWGYVIVKHGETIMEVLVDNLRNQSLGCSFLT